MSENVRIPAKNAGFEMIFGLKTIVFWKFQNFLLIRSVLEESLYHRVQILL